MTIRFGLIVLIRFFMVIAALQLLMSLLASVLMGTMPLPLIAATCLAFIPLLLVYWFSGGIVDLMTPTSNDVAPETSFRLDDLQAIAFSALGIYILYSAVQQTISLVSYIYVSRSNLGSLAVPPDIIAAPPASWAIGLYLLIGAPQIRRWIMWIRRAGPRIE